VVNVKISVVLVAKEILVIVILVLELTETQMPLVVPVKMGIMMMEVLIVNNVILSVPLVKLKQQIV